MSVQFDQVRLRCQESDQKIPGERKNRLAPRPVFPPEATLSAQERNPNRHPGWSSRLGSAEDNKHHFTRGKRRYQGGWQGPLDFLRPAPGDGSFLAIGKTGKTDTHRPSY